MLKKRFTAPETGGKVCRYCLINFYPSTLLPPKIISCNIGFVHCTYHKHKIILWKQLIFGPMPVRRNVVLCPLPCRRKTFVLLLCKAASYPCATQKNFSIQQCQFNLGIVLINVFADGVGNKPCESLTELSKWFSVSQGWEWKHSSWHLQSPLLGQVQFVLKAHLQCYFLWNSKKC